MASRQRPQPPPARRPLLQEQRALSRRAQLWFAGARSAQSEAIVRPLATARNLRQDEWLSNRSLPPSVLREMHADGSPDVGNMFDAEMTRTEARIGKREHDRCLLRAPLVAPRSNVALDMGPVGHIVEDNSGSRLEASTTRGARTKLSRTSSRFRIPRRPRAALRKSRCSPVFNMTTAASLDARSGAMPILDSLRADEICSQHDRPRDRGGQGRLSEILEILKSYRV